MTSIVSLDVRWDRSPTSRTRSSTASGWRSSRYRVANFTILARPTNSSPRPWRSKILSTTNGRSCTTRWLPHPAMFVQNAITRVRITAENQNLWVENSWVGERWSLASENIITGVPENDWDIWDVPGEGATRWRWRLSAKRTGWCAPTAITTLLQGRNSRRSSFPSLTRRRRRACCCASCWARRRRRKRRRPMRRLGS